MRNLALAIFLTWLGPVTVAFAQDDDADLGQSPLPIDSGVDSLIDDESSQSWKHSGPVRQVNQGDNLKVEKSTIIETEPQKSKIQLSPGGAESEAKKVYEGRRRPSASFGFGLAKVASIGKYNHYEYLYGKKRPMANFYAGYYFGSLLFDFGFMARLGYYNANGHPLANRGELERKVTQNLSEEAIDFNQKLELTLIPIQGTVELGLAPFRSRWLVFRGWVGYESLYVQETLAPNLPSGKSDSSGSGYANTGWNTGLVMGAMASFSLNGIEPRSDYSLRSIGIDRFYISPFLEVVKTLQAELGNFDRKNYGIAFSFEGLR